MLERLLSAAQRRELLAKIRPCEQDGVFVPLQGSSASLIVALSCEDRPGPALVVAPRLDDAEALAADLATLLPEQPVLHFPEFEILPYDKRSPYKGITGHRVEVLHRVLSGEDAIVVTSAKGLCWKVQPPEEILDYTLQVRKGARLDYDATLARLTEMGYYAVPRVEAPGDFARKGGILDVFSVSYENPLRIELLGDEVESIRFFDATTQRSMQEIDTALLPPCSPLILSEANVQRALDRVQRLPHGREHDKDRLCEHIRERLHFEGMERYAPFYSERVLLPAFFLNGHRMIWVSPRNVAGQLRRLDHEIHKLFEDAVRAGEPVPQPEQVFATPEELFELAAGTEGLYLAEVHTGGHPLGGLLETDEEAEAQGSGGDGAAATADPTTADTDEDAATATGAGAGTSAAPEPTTPVHDTGAYRAVRLPVHTPEAYGGRVPALRRDLERRLREGQRIHIFCDNPGQADRLRDLLDEIADAIDFPIGELQSGFVLPALGIVVLTDREIFERYKRRQRRRKYRVSQGVSAYEELQPGDFVVHVNYGIARYLGIQKIEVEGNTIDCLQLAFDGGDKIYVTIDQLNMVEKYVGKEGVEPRLSRLGTNAWERTKARARKAIADMAEELLELAAIRQSSPGHAYPADTPLEKELEASFIYEETPDQHTAIEEVKADLQKPVPMDRLVCGDVGYGKTEVALRAAFKAVSDSRQVAILVPTTILAQQHYTTFRERFADFPVTVEMLSRLRSPRQQKEILARVERGEVDIVIGTHRLLSRDVTFRNLGLLVIDEEHRFGVKHKERLKQLKKTIDVLSMSATPIPRTLNMALIGLRDMSLINTAPRDRLPVQTEIVPFDEEIIVDAMMRELDRGGQVYFVHNRVQSIDAMAGYVKRILPAARVGVAHGQMHERDLERVMLQFLDHEFDVLVSTMIIESGLDIPSVNTLIVNRADRLGLAQLYQLRGRVGRSSHKAYAYFMVPRGGRTTDLARKRLAALQEFEALGSGLRIAMRDMEIRGAGNILGPEQHGQLVAVGFDLYCRLLEQTAAELQGREIPEEIATKVEVDVDYRIPASYVPDAEEKMRVYKRLASATEPQELEALREELEDRYGKLPEEAINLLRVSALRLKAWAVGADKVRVRGGQADVTFRDGRILDRAQIEDLVQHVDNKLGFDVTHRFRITQHLRKGSRLEQVERLLDRLLESTAATTPAAR